MPPIAPLASLLTSARGTFDDTSGMDVRTNWDVSGGKAVCLGASTNDLRIAFDTPTQAGRATVTKFDAVIPSSNLKINLGGNGSKSGRTLSEEWMAFQYYSAAEMVNSYPRLQLVPGTTGVPFEIDNVEIYDLGDVDPSVAPCDVIIVGGDSNSANATSEKFGVDIGSAERETPFDPRIWYMPHLRVTGIYGNTGSVRHVPQPCIEPVVTVEAVRMSPVHAVAGRLVEWSAARGRPLLVMAMGDPGSGLMNTEDWRSDSAVATTGGRMWNELVAMKAAVDALGPAHEIVGTVWSMGANDRYNAGSVNAYDSAHLPVYSKFFADVRALVGDIPMVLWNIGDQLVRNAQTSGNLGFGIYMQDWLARFDKDSGHSSAIDRLTVVHPQDGNQLAGDDDPHYNAHGMQQNGRDAGDALRALLEG
ncbi:hypothetical protein IQ782_02955 [Salipiger pacificus]|uniref:GDSL-like Lipase/Acylhydrolase family protein n=1 Tax=Salipiger mangrovisoli TaxID=2865933 RepID=A0ABR9WWX4_9RHOB|nr:hypothetical protein [Salipiger mangrovisoli]